MKFIRKKLSKKLSRLLTRILKAQGLKVDDKMIMKKNERSEM